MANFPGFALTNQGQALLAKAISGVPLEFSKVALGAGELNGDITDLTELIDVKIDNIGIISILRNGENSILRVSALNAGISAPFMWREIGVYAIDPDDGEILYAASNAGSSADVVPAPVTTVMNYLIDVVTFVGTAADVTAIVLPPVSVYVTQQELSAHNAAQPAHPYLINLISQIRAILGVNPENTEATDVTITGGDISNVQVYDTLIAQCAIENTPIGSDIPAPVTASLAYVMYDPLSDHGIGNRLYNDSRYGIIRLIRLNITHGTNANSLSCQIVSQWRGDVIASTDNIVKDSTVGSFSLNATGTVLTIAAAAFTGGVVAVLTGVIIRNGVESNLCAYVGSDSNGDMWVNFSLSGADIDITSIVGGGEQLNIRIAYVTSQ